MKKFLAKISLVSLLVFFFQIYFLISPSKLNSANLTSVADTLSTSRLSYYAELTTGNTVDSSLVRIETSGNFSNSTANLFTGDTVWIGNGGTGSTYTVDDILDTDEFQLTTGLGSGDTDENDLAIATRSATHTVTFTTSTAIPNGSFRILIPSGTDNNNDGIPNHDGFDFNSITSGDLTQPTGGGVDSWDTTDAPTATASGGTWCSAGNHCFEARYNGTNNVSASLTFIIGDSGGIELINPAPDGSGDEGAADSYNVTVQHLDSDYNVIDSTVGSIAVVESVRVTATVDPIINFTITGIVSTTSKCGGATDITTTATTVPFGTLAISSFIDAAQNLKVSTNADGGYSVTAVENDQLGKDGGTDPFIADTPGDNGSASHILKDEWNTTTVKGFGYSLSNNDAAAIDFEYDDSSGTCTGGFCAKQFADNANPGTPEPAQELFSSTTVADSQDVDICYRAIVGVTQEAGDYENNITFTATATF